MKRIALLLFLFYIQLFGQYSTFEIEIEESELEKINEIRIFDEKGIELKNIKRENCNYFSIVKFSYINKKPGFVAFRYAKKDKNYYYQIIPFTCLNKKCIYRKEYQKDGQVRNIILPGREPFVTEVAKMKPSSQESFCFTFEKVGSIPRKYWPNSYTKDQVIISGFDKLPFVETIVKKIIRENFIEKRKKLVGKDLKEEVTPQISPEKIEWNIGNAKLTVRKKIDTLKISKQLFILATKGVDGNLRKANIVRNAIWNSLQGYIDKNIMIYIYSDPSGKLDFSKSIASFDLNREKLHYRGVPDLNKAITSIEKHFIQNNIKVVIVIAKNDVSKWGGNLEKVKEVVKSNRIYLQILEIGNDNIFSTLLQDQNAKREVTISVQKIPIADLEKRLKMIYNQISLDKKE